MTVTFYVTIGPDGLGDNDYTTCAGLNAVNIGGTTFSLNDIKGVSGCPDITGTWTRPDNFQQGTLCTDNRKKADVGGGTFCCKYSSPPF